ncbi:AMP-binding protein [Aquihabitans sp. G128]|uniref:class I adenylate-forming enzyme family protein n=1 Tax=Aquihabitans sp. G128 TaxID=2849779 RepID=UPI001C22D03B|nr:AMP-binding protein [Aquihabitans sp. G128]QXC60370.1 AMP-binding protein [Aquihabitans sp. G128]
MRLLDRIALARGRELTLGTLMERLAAIHGDRPFVTEADGGFAATFAEAAALVDRWAGGIAAQSEPGSRVVLATANGYEQFLLTLAASRAGRVPAPVNGQMSKAEIEHVVADSGASLVVRAVADVDDAEVEPFGPAAAADPGDIGALFYTSGTTGKPKGAELTHRGLVGGMSMAALLPSGLRRDEVVLGLPVAHIFGFTAVVGAACGGLPVYFFPRFNPAKALDAIESRRATIFVGVPAMYRMLLEAGAEDRDLTSVRLWISGADAMPTELATRFKRFGATATLPLVGPIGEASFAEGYGMVETGGGVAVRLSPPLLPAGLGGSVGVPLPGNTFKVVGDDGEEVAVGGVGELLLSGPGVLKGYHGAPEATAAALTDDGWLRTGDLARRGVAGMVNFEGRMKDVIKRGGYSVYALEVEKTLEEHQDVLEAAVVPVPDDRDGEVPVAAVRLRPGADLASLDLGAWAAERLSKYKVPLRFVAVDDLPRTGTNKVQRKEVVALVEDASDAPGAEAAAAGSTASGSTAKASAKRAPAKRGAAKKAAGKKAPAKKAATTKAPAKKGAAKKAATSAAPAKRAPAK